MNRVIWQYWETRGEKPKFIDGLYEIAKKNSGVKVVQVTPESLKSFLPELPHQILDIQELAHKADMIRSLLVQRHGGMWLDSDAIVLQDLNWLFDLVEGHEFVGFYNPERKLGSLSPVQVNCFLSRPGGRIVSEWVRLQHSKFPRTTYKWLEIGSEILHPLCVENPNLVKLLPSEIICPIPWQEVELFSSRWPQPRRVQRLVDKGSIIMMHNKLLGERVPEIRNQTVEELASGETCLGYLMRKAVDRNYKPQFSMEYRWKAFRNTSIRKAVGRRIRRWKDKSPLMN